MKAIFVLLGEVFEALSPISFVGMWSSVPFFPHHHGKRRNVLDEGPIFITNKLLIATTWGDKK